MGTGRMASGIVAATSSTGAEVVVVGRSLERARVAAREASELGADIVRPAVLERNALDGVDIVIETVVEDIEVKRAVFAQVESMTSSDVLIATNTSGHAITELASLLSHPARFAGLHFLYPAHLTLVAEVVPGASTSATTVDSLVGLVTAMGKTPLSLRSDLPGGLWNRLQFALLREALFLLEAGVADAATIDAAVAHGLAPRWVVSGPLATADLGGLETFSRAAASILPTLDCSTQVPRALSVRARTGDGFYRWTPDDVEAMHEARSEAVRMASELRTRWTSPLSDDIEPNPDAAP